jgi:chloride channel 7
MAPRDQNGGGSGGGAADPEADIEAPLISPGSSFFFQDTAALEDADGDGDGDGEVEQQRRARWRFLSSFGRLRSNVTSQVALVGTDVCPIESLDYEYAPRRFSSPNLRQFAR